MFFVRGFAARCAESLWLFATLHHSVIFGIEAAPRFQKERDISVTRAGKAKPYRTSAEPPTTHCSRLTAYSFNVLASSTSNDSRLRKTAMMIPKPTAASAAATVITMKTNYCPDKSRKKLENATNVRFTAFSINSMHMNIEMTLRLTITPTTPIVKSTAESARYHESCGVIRRT